MTTQMESSILSSTLSPNGKTDTTVPPPLWANPNDRYFLPKIPPNTSYTGIYAGRISVPKEGLDGILEDVKKHFELVSCGSVNSSTDIIEQIEDIMLHKYVDSLYFRQISGYSPISKTERAIYYWCLRKRLTGRKEVPFSVHIEHSLKNWFDCGFRDRLKCTTIESLTPDELLDKYDSESAFFCIDLTRSVKQGKKSLSEEDHARLCARLKSLKGKFMIINTPSAFLKEIYSGFHFEEGVLKFDPFSRRILIQNYE